MSMVRVRVFIDGIYYAFYSNIINPRTLAINLPQLKEEIEWRLGVPKQNQRIMDDGKEIVDGYKYPCADGLSKQDSYLVVDHQESAESPYHMSKEFMRQRWPSMPEEELSRQQIELNDLSKGVVDRYSLTEDEDEDTINKSKELSSQVVMVQLFSPTGTTIVENGNCLTFKGQKMYLYELLEDGSGVTLESATFWRYRRSTPEDYHQIKESNAKHEENLRHCVKLLHELPIALANSEKALAAVDISSEYFDVYELGAMVYEQKTIRREIGTQEAKLQLFHSQPLNRLDRKKLFKFHYFSSLTLKYGVNRLPTDGIIQLVRVSDIDKTISNHVSITSELHKFPQTESQDEIAHGDGNESERESEYESDDENEYSGSDSEDEDEDTA